MLRAFSFELQPFMCVNSTVTSTAPPLPPAPRAVHLPPAQHVNFAEEVQFVVEATGCSRRAAIDALMAQDTAEDAIVWLLNQ